MTQPIAIQDRYPDDVAHCHGCGALNEHGLQLKSRVIGDHTEARFTPRPEHTAVPGYVYGGLIASLIDCHGTGTAAAAGAAWDAADDPEQAPLLDASVITAEAVMPRYVTGKLEVTYRKPTPLGPELVIRGTVRERSARKVVVDITLGTEDVVTAEGVVIAVRMPEDMVGGG